MAESNIQPETFESDIERVLMSSPVENKSKTSVENCIQWERELLNREKELLNRERALLQEEKHMYTMNNSEQTKTFMDVSSSVVIPEFNPTAKNGLTAKVWTRKLEEIATVYNWDQRVLLYQAIAKLRGAAKHWFDANVNCIISWDLFKNDIIRSFPVYFDESDIHLKLMKRQKKNEEQIEDYVYEMVAIAGQSPYITDQALLKYIIAGLRDRELIKTLSVCELDDVQSLLAKIKQYEATMTQMKHRQAENNATTTDRVRPLENKRPRCYNCGEQGHKSTYCEKREKGPKCFKCEQYGHISTNCKNKRESGKKNTEDRQVRRVVMTELRDEYHKIVKVDGNKIEAFIDLGSDCVTMQQLAADRLGVEYRPCSILLRGFGEGKACSVGKGHVVLEIDGLTFEADVIIVPTTAQDEEMIIGNNVFQEPDIKIVIEYGKLNVTRKEQEVKIRRIYKINKEEIDVNRSLSNEQQEEIINLLEEYSDCFADKIQDIGKTSSLKMKIDVTTTEPIAYRPYRVAYSERKIIQQMCDELLQADIIRESNSDYASPILLVKKKDNEYRMCVDYRKLNSITKKEKYPMARIDDQLDRLANKKYYCLLDFKSGYHQIQMEEDSIPKTAFITPDSHYEFTRVPFGLVNAPSIFQKMMNKLIHPVREHVLVYMDDILVPSSTFDEGITLLRKLLELIKEANLTLNLKKCSLFAEKVDYLGYEIDINGVRPGQRKINAVRDFQRPQDVHQLRQFLGLCSFFRRFISGFASIAEPLTRLTKKNEIFDWGEEQENKFQELKNKLTDRPVLAHYDVDAEVELHTDASKIGLAGILLQKVEKDWKPIAYYSRRTTENEAKYHSFELEALAVVESVDRFRVYVLNKSFKVVTDCNSLRAAMQKKDMNPRIGRWCLRLQDYDITYEHRSSNKLIHADALSRQPNEESQEVETATVIMHISSKDFLLTMQLQDDRIKRIYEVLNRTPTSNEDRQIHAEYKIEENKVCRKISNTLKWVVPKAVRWRVVKSCHDDFGHYGYEKTLQQVKKYYWFRKMNNYVKNYIAACVQCAYHKITGGKREGNLHCIEKVAIPFHTTHIDFLGPFPKSTKGNAYVSAYICAFTKYIVLRAVKDTTAKTAVNCLTEVIEMFGPPYRLISDRGTSYTAKEFEAECARNDIQHILNATATPRANGQIERYNRTLLTALTTLTSEDNKHWCKKIKQIQWALNTIPNKTTQRSPHDLLFAFKPRDSLQNLIILALDEGESIDEEEMLRVRDEADKRIKEGQKVQKKHFDARHKRPTTYEVDDLVLVERESAATGESRKLTPKFKGPYLVTHVLPNDRYILEDVPGAERTQRTFKSTFSSDRMKRWCRLPVDTDSDEEDDDDDEKDDDPGTDQKQDGRTVNSKREF